MGGELILTICAFYDVFAQGDVFGGRNDCTCVKVFSSVNFLKLRLIPESVNGLI